MTIRPPVTCPHAPPFRIGGHTLRAVICGLALWIGGAGIGAWAAFTEAELQIQTEMEDDPHRALATAGAAAAEALARGDFATASTMLLLKADAHASLEERAEASRSLEEAAALLARLTSATPVQQSRLALARINAAIYRESSASLLEKAARLRPQIEALGHQDLLLLLTSIEGWLHLDLEQGEHTWRLAEQAEKLALASGRRTEIAKTLLLMGQTVARMQPNSNAALDYFRRSQEALGTSKARHLRSLIAWETSILLVRREQWPEALQSLRETRALSLELGDEVGVAWADLRILRTLVQLGRVDEASALLPRALQRAEEKDDAIGRPLLAQLDLEIAMALKRPTLPAAIERAHRFDNPQTPGDTRAALVLSLAAAHASQGRYQLAYAEALRGRALERAWRSGAAEEQALKLQARYEAARREAENNELRLRTQATELKLEAQSARQSGLWAALLLLIGLLAAVGYWGGRALRRRRAQAELALRDELTGQPNRRAVRAYAQAQFRQCRKFGVPLTLALIDLDHFKRVNDTYGHPAGDATLRAFAVAASTGLRGHDRLGRWGGEEWLLVMPGAIAAELPLVFERMRNLFANTPIDGLPRPHGLTFSMGGAQLGDGNDDLDALIAQADRELYAAKNAGRNMLSLAA